MPRTDHASKVVAASTDRVYRALVDAAELAVWLPPNDMTGTIDHFDARPGGSFRIVLTYADATGGPGKSSANTDVVEGQFVDLVPGKQVVWAVDFIADDPEYAGTMTMTWNLSAVEGATRVEIVATNVPDGITAEDHRAGMTASLVQLAAFLSNP